MKKSMRIFEGLFPSAKSIQETPLCPGGLTVSFKNALWAAFTRRRGS